LAKGERPIVLNANLRRHPLVDKMLSRRQKIFFSAHEPADFCFDGECLCRQIDGHLHKLLPVAKMQLKGQHNYENALAVLALGEAMGVPVESLLPGLGNFSSGEHRLATVGVFGGVRYINDSKGTNVDAVIRALEFCAEGRTEKKIILIAGGIDKGCTLEEAKTALKMYVKGVCAFGACRERLASSWGAVVPVVTCESLAQTVATAKDLAEPGDTVLFSPGCSSFDMFQSYADRGRKFMACVQELVEGYSCRIDVES
jgi:UDP-N-acetylmuramoylalanine--D-glutamate ligase